MGYFRNLFRKIPAQYNTGIHEGDLQRGKDFDLVFADNINTETYWEAKRDIEENPQSYSPDTSGIFPMWCEDWKCFIYQAMDFLVNWEEDFARFDDERIVFITKDGHYIHSDDYETSKEFYEALKPFSENHFAAAIFNSFGYEYFWINGWQGAYMLQEYTGWFDFDIYDDWI